MNCEDEKVAECKKSEMTKDEFLEGLEPKGITLEANNSMVVEKYERLAESKGITLEAYKAAVMASK